MYSYSPLRSSEQALMILVGSFQLEMFYDCVSILVFLLNYDPLQALKNLS